MIKYLEKMYNTSIEPLPNNLKQLIEEELE